MMNGTSSSLFPCTSSIIFLFYMKYKVEEMLQHSLQLALTTLCIAKHSPLFFYSFRWRKWTACMQGRATLVWGGGGGGLGVSLNPQRKVKRGPKLRRGGPETFLENWSKKIFKTKVKLPLCKPSV